MFFSNKNFPILFRERKAWTARGLVKDIANILNDGLFLEYYKLYDKAPIRGKVDEIEIFRDDHNGAVDRDVGSIKLTEKRFARALWNYGKLTFPDRNGFIRLLDYEFPLSATANNKGIGEVDLLGVTDGGVLSIIELKYMKEGRSSNDSPLFALVEALRYYAIIEANLELIKVAVDKKRKKAAKINDQRWQIPDLVGKPSIQLIGNTRYWNYWLDSDRLNKIGDWQVKFNELLASIQGKLGIETE